MIGGLWRKARKLRYCVECLSYAIAAGDYYVDTGTIDLSAASPFVTEAVCETCANLGGVRRAERAN